MAILPQDIEKLKQAFGDREFTGKELAAVLELPTFHGTGWRIKWLRTRDMIHVTNHGYRFGPAIKEMIAEITPAPAQIAPVVTSELVCNPPSLVRIGELYLHERMLLIADTARQEASQALRIYTTIIEVDPGTKHPRNKVINFVKTRDPREYAQAMAWLDDLAGTPHAVDETALELAAELESKLNVANKEIAELKAKIEAIRGMFRGEL